MKILRIIHLSLFRLSDAFATCMALSRRPARGDQVPAIVRMQQPFNLRFWFALTAFVIICLICVVSASWVANFMTRSLLERESEVSQEFFQSIVQVESDAIFESDAHSQPPNRPLLEFAKHIVNTPGVMRANLYSGNRKILWSTEPQLIGQSFSDNPDLERALRGNRITEINTIEHHKAEYVAFGETGLFIEAYMPLRASGGDRRVVGVVELYKFPTALNATISEGRRIIWLFAAGAAVVLYLSLYWIVQRGAMLIERQQQQLSGMQAFAAIGELASAVAHSLRNPMSSIRSSAELWRGELPSEKTGIADDVIQEIDRMDAYVRDLLVYARSDRANLHTVDPLTSVATVLAKRDIALRRSNITVRQVDRRLQPANVIVDPALFEHALTSIVTNAIEAMPEGGNLEIAVATDAGSRHVTVEVKDSGPGIPQELLNRITDSYFTTKSKGLGLGLALARGIIERWGGTLKFSSGDGAGGNVIVTLKRA